MKLYLVRHAESLFNKQNLHQHGKVPLSETGEKQAHLAACRFKTIHIDVMLTSYMTRAVHTSEIINTVLQKEIVKTDLLKELKRPTEIEGKSLFAEEIKAIKKTIREKSNDPTFHYSDEENFYDLKKRIQQAIEYINTRQEKNILVVTHAVVIRIIIALMCLGETLTPDQFYMFEHRLHIANTGLSLCERKENGDWHVLTINDYAHLGE